MNYAFSIFGTSLKFKVYYGPKHVAGFGSVASLVKAGESNKGM